MKYSYSQGGVSVMTAMIAALIVTPAVAVNSLSDDDFLAMTNSQAEVTEMPGALSTSTPAVTPIQQPAQKVDSAAVKTVGSATVVTGNESTEITAARLGVMTPYGKRALVQEMRNYYPGSYREFRTLDGQQVNELVVLFEETGNLNQVLGRMDNMAVK